MVEDNITKILLNWNFYFLKPFLYVCFWYSEIIQSVLFCFAQARSSLPLRARHGASSPVRVRSTPLLGSSSLSECKKAPNKSGSLEREKGVIRSESRARARSSLPLRARHRASSPPSPFTGFAHKVEVVGPSSRFLVPFSIKKDALQRLFVLEREKGLGPSTPTLARSCSTN